MNNHKPSLGFSIFFQKMQNTIIRCRRRSIITLVGPCLCPVCPDCQSYDLQWKYRKVLRLICMSCNRVFELFAGKKGFQPGHQSHAKPHYFVTPSKQIIRISNLKKFADMHELTHASLASVLRGAYQQYFGWTKFRWDKFPESFIQWSPEDGVIEELHFKNVKPIAMRFCIGERIITSKKRGTPRKIKTA